MCTKNTIHSHTPYPSLSLVAEVPVGIFSAWFKQATQLSIIVLTNIGLVCVCTCQSTLTDSEKCTEIWHDDSTHGAGCTRHFMQCTEAVQAWTLWLVKLPFYELWNFSCIFLNAPCLQIWFLSHTVVAALKKSQCSRSSTGTSWTIEMLLQSWTSPTEDTQKLILPKLYRVYSTCTNIRTWEGKCHAMGLGWLTFKDCLYSPQRSKIINGTSKSDCTY